MEELSWERNMTTFPWSNMNHHQQQTEETIIFGSEKTFPNPIQHLPKASCSTITSTPTNGTASRFGSASQYWRQTLALNTTTDTSLESLDQEEGISVIFSDYNYLCNKTLNNVSGVSSDDSITKETIDEITVSQSSTEQKSNHCRVFYEENHPKSKRPKPDPVRFTSSILNFSQSTDSTEPDSEAIAQMKEMIYRAAAFRPVSFADEEVEKPKRRNVRISSDPQTVAARKRRERVSERIRVLQKLVPGGDKMDTASMLDEAANYLKFLRSQVKMLEQFGKNVEYGSYGTTVNAYGITQNVENVSHNVTLGVPYPMHGHFYVPHQQIYHAPPHA